MILDEVQLVPDLFPAIKEMVRVSKKPGQFLLSGSVRFTSRKAIKESLTGRIINLELLPFSLSELLHLPVPNLGISFLKAVDPKMIISKVKAKFKGKVEYTQYFTNGGLPGVCFIRNEKLRNLRISDQLNTILDRDIRLVYPTTLPYIDILQLCESLSKVQGLQISYTDLKQETNISTPTIKKLISSFESIFLLRLLPIRGGRKGHICFFEDQAESRFFQGGQIDPYQDYIQMIYRNVRTEYAYSIGEKFQFFHYRTINGSTVPFAVETNHGILGYYPTQSAEPSHAELMSAQSFIKKMNGSKVIFLHPKAKTTVIDSRTIILPDMAVLLGSY